MLSVLHQVFLQSLLLCVCLVSFVSLCFEIIYGVCDTDGKHSLLNMLWRVFCGLCWIMWVALAAAVSLRQNFQFMYTSTEACLGY